MTGFTELIAPPPDVRVFSATERAGLGDCAASGRMRLDAIAGWLQDVAYGDVDDAGVADEAIWVVRRTRIRVDRFPRFGEHFTLHTFCSGLGRMWAERRTTIVPEPDARGPGAPSIEAVSLWVHLDPATRRPAPFTPRELAIYALPDQTRRITARLRHPLPPESAASTRWTFRHTDCDVADHVNNTAYWQPLEEELITRPEPDPEALDVELEFRTPAQPGEKLVLAAGEHRWITSGDRDELHASLQLDIGRRAEGGS